MQARIVIVGGGITGVSIAYHLALKGETDVILVEKDELTSGSTCHAAGLVTQFHTNMPVMRMRLYSVDLYSRLMAEHGAECGWHGTGSLRLATGDDQYMALKRAVSAAKGIGLELDILSPEEAHRYWPQISLDGVKGAIWLPTDGWLDPHGMVSLLAREARRMGTTMLTQTRVTDVVVEDREVKAVQTTAGRIDCEILINAAGMWAPRLAEMVGVVMPMVPVNHQHLTTVPSAGLEFPPDTPVLRDRSHLIYIREEVRGLLIGGFELEPAEWHPEGVPWDHAARSLQPDFDQFGSIMEGAIARIPSLADAQVAHLVNHPDAMTPDGYPCVGPSPDVRGFWGAAGLSLNGFGMGGGLGWVLADMIVDGGTDIDMTPFDIRRFGPHYSDLDFTTARGKETYKHYYFLKFPDDEWESARPFRTSALYERLKDHGVVYGTKNGFERPKHFEPGQGWRQAGKEQRHGWQWGIPQWREWVREEHRATRERVALYDMSSFGKLDVHGPGALAFLQRMAANNVRRPMGRLTYTQFLNASGGIESDLTIGRTGPESFRIITGTSSVSIDRGWLELHRPDDVQIDDVTMQYACLSLWGPRSREVLEQLTEDDVSQEGFPYMATQLVRLAGVELRANRVSFSGELGYELYPPRDEALTVFNALMEAGEVFDIRPAGYRAIDSLRLEKGYLVWGSDMTPLDDPISAGLKPFVRLKKPDFMGRDAVAAVAESGPLTAMSTLVMDPESCVLYGGEAVFCDGQVVGRLRSGGYGFTVNKNIGFAYLPVELSAGSMLEVESFGERLPAEVVAGPLYDPDGSRIR
jgi:4-methylaminobutanoate oxidase (formaldehyde-forming)